jgi:hypothetical protein
MTDRTPDPTPDPTPDVTPDRSPALPALAMHAVVLDCAELEPLVRFWSAALGVLRRRRLTPAAPSSAAPHAPRARRGA